MEKDIGYGFIRAAVERGIRDVRTNQGRGLLKLVDLGVLLGGRPFKDELFHIVKNDLHQPDSLYRRLAERVATGTDEEILTEFGLNLGYGSLFLGARKLRKLGEDGKFLIPWCITVDLRAKALPLPDIAEIFQQGKRGGILTYLLFLPKSYPDYPGLFSLFRRMPDLALFLFPAAEDVGEGMARDAKRARNVLVSVELSESASPSAAAAAAALRRHDCLRAGHFRCGRMGANIPPTLSLCDRFDLPFLFAEGATIDSPAALEARRKELLRIRGALPCPVFPIDLPVDLLQIGKKTAGEACLLTVRGGEAATFTANGEVGERLPIREMTVGDILRRNLSR